MIKMTETRRAGRVARRLALLLALAMTLSLLAPFGVHAEAPAPGAFGSYIQGAAAVADADITASFTDTAFRNHIRYITGRPEPLPIRLSDVVSLDYLGVYELGIESLDGIEHLTGLMFLEAWGNELTGINLTYNTALEWLFVSENQLTSLELSANTELIGLWAWNNELTNISLSANTELAWIDVAENQLSSLNLANNTSLVGLSAGGNMLSTLTLPVTDTLESLYIYDNQLTALDVSGNPYLWEIWASNNNLTGLFDFSNKWLQYLDVSDNPNIEVLAANGNQLEYLDVSGNTGLEVLWVENNQLTWIDVSDNTNLWMLDASDNNLSELDLTNNEVLTFLYVSENQLESLDLTGNPYLIELSAWRNRLTALNLSANEILTWLDVDFNRLTELDVSQNPELESISVRNNQLRGLDLSYNTLLSGRFVYFWLEEGEVYGYLPAVDVRGNFMATPTDVILPEYNELVLRPDLYDWNMVADGPLDDAYVFLFQNQRSPDAPTPPAPPVAPPPAPPVERPPAPERPPTPDHIIRPDESALINNPTAPGQVANAVDAIFESAYEDGVELEQIVLQLPEGAEDIRIQDDVLERIAEAGLDLVIIIDDVVIVLPPELLAELARRGDPVINIHVEQRIAEDEDIEVTVRFTGRGNRVITGFTNPIRVVVDLRDAGVLNPNPHRVVAMDANGRIIGGSYNRATSLFTFYTNRPGDFTIAMVPDLIRLSISVDRPLIFDLAGNAPTQIMDTTPVVGDDGRTMIPLRFLVYAFGGNVDWNGYAQQVTITIDGRPLTLDVPGSQVQLINDRSMVPLRFVSEFFGALVTWDDATRTIEIIR